jgi:cell division protein FtsQ
MSARRNKGLVLLGLVLGVVALVVASSLWKSSLTVGRVVVEGNRIVETNEILQLAQVQVGAAMNDLDLTRIQNQVASNFFIKEAIVTRDLPATVRITVVERTPLAMVVGPTILYVDEDGVVLPHSISRELFDLPILSGWPDAIPLRPGTRVRHAAVREALDILIAAKLVSKELFHMISEVHLPRHVEGDIVLYGAERGTPILFGRGHVASKLVRLDAFWNDVVRSRGPHALEYIDLRYDDQVVVRWNSSAIGGSSSTPPKAG